MRRSAALALFVIATSPFACLCGDPGAGPGEECERAQDCQGQLVCDPDLGQCQEVTGCADDDECGAGALCENESCVQNVPGGRCRDDEDCVAGEVCRGEQCRVPGAEGTPCTSAEDCQGGLVCPSATDLCTGDVACDSNAPCGDAAYCGDDGDCERAEDGSPCEDDDQCTEDARCIGIVCVPDSCQGDAFAAEIIPANVLIILDRSGSMEDEIGNDGSKWDVARAAVYELLAAQGDNLRFGLNVYPGTDPDCDEGDFCEAGVVPVDVGPGTETDIASYLEESGTCLLGTPTAENLEMVLDYEGLQDPTRNNFVLLITDGQSTCANPAPRVAQLANADPPVPTFVVGFGDGVDPDELEDMAIAGGTALNGDPVYYQADDAASLSAALDDIVGAVLGCDYAIPDSPETAEGLRVYFDGQPVPQDTTGNTGWDYSPASGRLSFAGNACTALQNGLVTDLTIVYGCPVDEPPPPVDAGPGPEVPDAGDGCTDRCVHGCGQEACLLPQGGGVGECGPCEENDDCCPGSLCIVESGTCLPLGG